MAGTRREGAAQRALELNERSDFAHIVLGMIQLLCERDTAAAKREARRALELNPNYTLAMDLLGAATIFSGDAAAGLPHCERAAKANPRFPANGWFMQHVALGRFVLREHEATLAFRRRRRVATLALRPRCEWIASVSVIREGLGPPGLSGRSKIVRSQNRVVLRRTLRPSHVRRHSRSTLARNK